MYFIDTANMHHFRWDTRNMNEPTDSMIIDMVKLPTDTQSIDSALGISALEYEPTIPTRYNIIYRTIVSQTGINMLT